MKNLTLQLISGLLYQYRRNGSEVAVDLPHSGALDESIDLQRYLIRHLTNRFQANLFVDARDQDNVLFPATHTA